MERWNALPCLTLLVLACQGCMMSGGGTEGEGLTGTFVNPQGQPVAGVTVKLYDADDENALSKATSTHEYSDSTVTDASGRYRFSSLGKGRYNLEGISGNGGNAEAIFIPSIKFEGALDLGTDTLHVPGGIRIHIRSNGTPQEGVLCYVPGTSLLAISDDLGQCLMTGVAAGLYRVRLRYDGLLTVTSSDIQVKPGVITDVGILTMTSDPSQNPPTPKGVTVRYDSISGIATVTWKRVEVSDLAGYVIYRRPSLFATPERLIPTTTLVMDTIFRDTSLHIMADSIPLTYVYQVKAQDLNGNLSNDYSDPATLVFAPKNNR